MLESLPRLLPTDFPDIQRGELNTLQVNLGFLCNQQCLHCHVAAGPRRTEIMDSDTVDQVIEVLRNLDIQVMDLTGGAPEMNPHFKRLVSTVRDLGIKVIDRCNLTILTEAGYEDLAVFLAEQQVEIVASLPCYLAENVDRQRGKGVFDGSLEGLKQLNALGYGQPDSDLKLNLVYNPQGPVLPPDQDDLEKSYREILNQEYGIVFNQLLALANLPVGRFGSTLISKGEFDQYVSLLRSSHQDANLEAVMCRNLISVDWQGYLYDCDFNQMLTLPLQQENHHKPHLRDLKNLDLKNNRIVTGNHCYGCTAGQGSSCGGALG